MVRRSGRMQLRSGSKYNTNQGDYLSNWLDCLLASNNGCDNYFVGDRAMFILKFGGSIIRIAMHSEVTIDANGVTVKPLSEVVSSPTLTETPMLMMANEIAKMLPEEIGQPRSSKGAPKNPNSIRSRVEAEMLSYLANGPKRKDDIILHLRDHVPEASPGTVDVYACKIPGIIRSYGLWSASKSVQTSPNQD